MAHYQEGTDGGYLHKVRLSNMASGRNIFGSKTISYLTELSSGDVCQFLYKADSPGVDKRHGIPGSSLYDYAPLVYVTEIKRSKAGKIILYGCNLHYLDKRVDRNKVIISLNLLSRVPRSLHHQTIHAYRADRVKSKIYRSFDITRDKDISLTMPQWKHVESR